MKNSYQALPRLCRISIVVFCVFIASLVTPQVIADGAQNTGAVIPLVEVPSEVSLPESDATSAADRGLKFDYSVTPTSLHVVLPRADTADRQSTARTSKNGPLKIGFERDMPSEFQGDLTAQLDWIPLEDGSFVGAMSVTSPDASAMRVGILAEPVAGAEIRFFGKYADQLFPKITQTDFFKGREPEVLWSTVVEGDTIGIEITLPSRKALSIYSIRIAKIAHIWRPIETLQHAPKELACSTHIDIQCRARNIRNRGNSPLLNAVGRIVYQRGGSSYVCSGTLVNDRNRTHRYFLTARHCVSTASVAGSVTAAWFFQRRACGSSELDRRYTTTSGGTDLLATSAAQDATLLRFRSRLPAGLTLSGWHTATINHPVRVHGIHHPDGGVKKWVAGRTRRNVTSQGVENAIEVYWEEGTTEGGSSGSGMFDRQRFPDDRLVGLLSHGTPTCEGTIDKYGSFRRFFPQVRRWLWPADDDTDDHGNTRTTATVVRAPSSTRGNIELNGDKDYFRVNLSQAGRLQVRTTGSTDTYGTLFRGSTVVARNDDGGAGTNFQITVPQAQRGVYYIEVRGYQTRTGPYTLWVEFSDACVCAPDERISDTDTLRIEFPGAPPPSEHTLPLVMSASSSGPQGFVRIINLSNRDGTVDIEAIDDSGRRFGPVSLSLDAKRAAHFNSRDLERGNPSQGLSRGVGSGHGNWRLEVRTELDIEPLAYLRSGDGFLTSIHEVAAEEEGAALRYHVPIFNPGDNRSQQSWLRLINPGAGDAEVVISGLDDRGNSPPESDVRLTLPAGAVRTLTAQQLEQGDTELHGRFGEGVGRWRLSVSANRPIQVMSLLQSSTGSLTNLSR